jgi:hypothetical protein
MKHGSKVKHGLAVQLRKSTFPNRTETPCRTMSPCSSYRAGFRSFWTASMGAAASLLLARPCGGGLARRVFGSRRCVPIDRRTARKERAGMKVVTLLRIPKAQNAFVYNESENQAAKWQRPVATSDCIQ